MLPAEWQARLPGDRVGEEVRELVGGCGVDVPYEKILLALLPEKTAYCLATIPILHLFSLINSDRRSYWIIQ